MYKSQLKKNYPRDWFCGPGSHLLSGVSILVQILYYTFLDQNM